MAEEGGRAWGVTIALVRERVWILSLFGVAAHLRDTGPGKNLLELALAYGDGCPRATIVSSRHPAAMRGGCAGFDLGPTFTASGAVRRGAIPSAMTDALGGRGGEEQGLDLAADVDRGRTRR